MLFVVIHRANKYLGLARCLGRGGLRSNYAAGSSPRGFDRCRQLVLSYTVLYNSNSLVIDVKGAKKCHDDALKAFGGLALAVALGEQEEQSKRQG